jgi:hypothetical protein
MLLKSPMLFGRVKPVLFPTKPRLLAPNETSTPCVIILMTESGNSPVKKQWLVKSEAELYTDATLALEFVAFETKNRQIDTIAQ